MIPACAKPGTGCTANARGRVHCEGSLAVEGSVFADCTTATWGWAIAVPGSAALNISRSIFTVNTAGDGGGALEVRVHCELQGQGALQNSSRETRCLNPAARKGIWGRPLAGSFRAWHNVTPFDRSN